MSVNEAGWPDNRIHTSNYQQSRLANRGIETGKSLDSECHVLLLLEAIDAQDDLSARPHGLLLQLVRSRSINTWVDDLQVSLGQSREDTLHNASSELAVDDNTMAGSSTPALNSIERHPVSLLQHCDGTFSFLSEQLIREMAVEQDADVRVQEAKERYGSTQLVDEEVRRSKVIEFVVP